MMTTIFYALLPFRNEKHSARLAKVSMAGSISKKCHSCPLMITPQVSPEQKQRTSQYGDNECGVTDSPRLGLRTKGQPRLNENGVSHQGEHASHIAGRIEEIRIACLLVFRGPEPPLYHGDAACKHDNRYSHRHGESCQKPERRRRQVRFHSKKMQSLLANAERKEPECLRQEHDVQDGLPARAQLRREMRVCVAAEQ